jgi:hypothetical protein
MGSSGANAAQCGILMGYKRIILVGCDCNYVERVEGSEEIKEGLKGELRMSKTPKENPNYWFNDYQREGDVYNLPKANTFQMNSWKYLYENTPDDVTIINCSEGSRIPFFPKQLITDVLHN